MWRTVPNCIIEEHALGVSVIDLNLCSSHPVSEQADYFVYDFVIVEQVKPTDPLCVCACVHVRARTLVYACVFGGCTFMWEPMRATVSHSARSVA